MSFVVADRVQETCVSPGTGTVNLLGAVTGYKSFSSSIGANNTCYYVIADQYGTNWEVGIGTIGSGGITLARTTVLASSNGGSLVAFTSGTQNVWVDYPATKVVTQDLIYAPSSFQGTFTDGIVMDYVTGNGRFSVGTADGFTWYNGGVGSTSLMTLLSNGNLGIGTTSPAISGSAFTILNVKGVSNTTALITATSGDLASSVQLYSGASTSDNPAIGYQKSLRFGTTTDTGIGGFSEKMRLDSSGNLGIGVTPSAWGGGNKALQVWGGALASNGLADTKYTNNLYYDGTNWKYLSSNAASEYAQNYLGQHVWYNAPAGTAGNTATLTQAMTLDSSGNLLVGLTSAQAQIASWSASSTKPAGRFFVNAASSLSQASVIIDKYDNNTTTSQVFVQFTINNQSIGSGQINANGASAAAFGSYSDARLKENIETLPTQLNNILALKPCEFDYKNGSGHQIGFIAQEMQKVYPDVVAEGEDGMLMITGWSKTEARLVKAIQELSAKVTALETQLGAK